MLSRLLTTKEQFVLVGVAAAVCVGGIAVFLSRPSEERAMPAEESGVREVVIREEVVRTAAPAVAPEPEIAPAPAIIESPKPVSVAITGAVAQPGVYTLQGGSRVIDLIGEAGGHLEHADLRDINMAAELINGTTLTVPGGAHASMDGGRLVVRGAPPAPVTNPAQYTISGWRNTEPARGQTATASSRNALEATAEKGLVDLNAATAEELESLPGIGPKKAQEIIAFRTAQPFRSVDDLLNVKGIGPKTLENLRPHVKVETPLIH